MKSFLLAVVCGLTACAYAETDVGIDHVPTRAVAVEDNPQGPKAAITMIDGGAAPETIKPNSVLYFTSATADSSGQKGSIIWIVTPDSIGKNSKRLEFNGASVLVVEVGPTEYILTVHQVAIKGDVGDVATVSIPVRGQTPDVDPDPPVVETLKAEMAREVAAVVTPETRDAYLGIAQVYGNTASFAELGHLKVDQIEPATDAAVVPFAKPVEVKWGAIKNGALARRLGALKTSGKLATVSDYVGVWKEIAVGIKAGAGAQPPPDPDPRPDDEDPPIPTAGLHVMIIYESEDRTRLPASQVGILTSAPLQKRLDELNAKYRIYDDDTDMQFEDKVWQDAMARSRDSLPWIIISNGKTGYEGKLPMTADETIKLIEEYKL